MENDVILHQGNYLTLSVDPHGYERVTDRTGHVIAILPFLEKEDEILLGVRWEPRSAWGTDPNVEFMSSITGGVEEGEDPFQAAKRELLEEAGIEIDLEDLLPLGKIHAAKCIDTTYHLFAVDITEIGGLPTNGKTDGSKGESLAHNELVDLGTFIQESDDAILLALASRLQKLFADIETN